MTSVAAQIESMETMPDKVAAEIGWRVWEVHGGTLHSLHAHHRDTMLLWSPYGMTTPQGIAWPRGKELEAVCASGSQPMWGWGIRSRSGVSEPIVAAPQDVPPLTKLSTGLRWEYTSATREHICPVELCSCGIYATDDEGRADIFTHYLDSPSSVRVAGRVNLWGKVVPGTKGWRAQFAYPGELFVLGKWKRTLSGRVLSSGLASILAEAYQVPVRVLSGWNEI